jgi:hypothetical protein
MPASGIKLVDANPAAFAVATRSQLVTFDAGFRKFQGLNLLVLGK